MENLKLTHEERRILKLNGILPQSIAKLVKSKVIRLAFKLGSKISMRESEKCYFIGITLPKSENLDLDLFEELKDDCKELERELIKAKSKINSLGELIKSYSEQFENKYSHIDNVEEITELIESIGLMLQDNANTINGYLELRMNRE